MSSLSTWVRWWPATALWLAGGLLCWPGAPAVQAVVVTNTLTVTTNYYFAYGATASALHQSLQQARPWGASASVDAQTVWSVSYRYNYQQVEGRFAPTRFELKTRITVTLPFWHTPKDVEPELRRRWLEYLRALYAHEQGHIDFARQASAELGQQLSMVGDHPSPRELRQTIERVSTNVIARVRRQEVQYDLTTKHGAAQGAVLRLGPPSQSAGGRSATAAPSQ